MQSEIFNFRTYVCKYKLHKYHKNFKGIINASVHKFCTMKIWSYAQYKGVLQNKLQYIYANVQIPSLVGICISRILPYLENNSCRASSEH